MPRIGQTGRQAGKRTTARNATAERLTPAQVRMERPKLLLSQEEAADELGVGLTYFRELRDTAQIHVISLGKRHLVPYASLVAYVRRLCDEQGVDYDAMALAG